MLKRLKFLLFTTGLIGLAFTVPIVSAHNWSEGDPTGTVTATIQCHEEPVYNSSGFLVAWNTWATAQNDHGAVQNITGGPAYFPSSTLGQYTWTVTVPEFPGHAGTLESCSGGGGGPPEPSPTPTPTPVDRPPVGSIDAATCDYIAGWAYDPDNTAESIYVHVYRDGPAGGGGVYVGSYLANVSRPDVNQAFSISGNHGFYISPLSESFKDGQSHTVYVYGINSSGTGSNPLLVGSPKTVNCPAVPPPACPSPNNYHVTLADLVIRRGENTQAFAPNGFSGGSFTSSNSSVASISSQQAGVAIVRGVGTGLANIGGTGWTAPNGATGCSLGQIAITVEENLLGSLSVTPVAICSPVNAGVSSVTASANAYAEVRVDNALGLPNNSLLFSLAANETKTFSTGPWVQAGTVFRLVAPFDGNLELARVSATTVQSCPTPTLTPTPTPSVTPTPTQTPSPTPIPTPTPSVTPTPTSTPTPTLSPTASPTPSVSPTPTPTPSPTFVPTPSATPTSPGQVAGHIFGSPNPCSIQLGQNVCTSNVTWTTENITSARVYVSMNGSPESLFGSALTCVDANCPANFITAEPDYYIFSLYDYSSSVRGQLLDSVRVTGKPVVTPPSNLLKGSFDVATCDTLSGWAVDLDSPSQSVKVQVYRNGPAGSGGIFVGEYFAHQPRPDVNQILNISGDHGFLVSPLPAVLLDGLSHSIYIYALSASQSGVRNLLPGSPRVISCPPPTALCPSGNVTQISLADTSINTGGTTWAFAPNGFSGGAFATSNGLVASIENQTLGVALILGKSAGVTQILGTGWTAPNGAQNCTLGAASLSVHVAASGEITATPATYCSPDSFGVTTVTASSNIYTEVRVDGAKNLSNNTLFFTVPAFSPKSVTTGPWVAEGTVFRLVAPQNNNVELARVVMHLTEHCPAVNAPSVDLKVKKSDGVLSDGPITVLIGTSVPLVWTSSNTVSCSAAWTSSVSVNGTEISQPLLADTVFSIKCKNAQGVEVSDSVVVHLEDLPSQGSDISVSKLADKLCAVSSDIVTFKVLVTNNGPRLATGVRIKDVWSGSFTFVSADASVGSFNNATQIWDVGSLATFANATLTIKLRAGAIGDVQNRVEASVSGSADYNLSNNISVVGLVVQSNCAGFGNTPTVDLKINGVDGPVTISKGASTTLSWTSTNTTTCMAQDGWTNSTSTAGSVSSEPVDSNRSFTIICTGPGGTATDTVRVEVGGAGCCGGGGGNPFNSHVYNSSTVPVGVNMQPCGTILMTWDRPTTNVDRFRIYYSGVNFENWAKLNEVSIGYATSGPGNKLQLEFYPPNQVDIFRYRLYTYFQGAETMATKDSLGSPIAPVKCDSGAGDLSSSNKDIIKIRNIALSYNRLGSQDSNISPALPIIEGNTVEFAINLVNSGTTDMAEPILVEDVMANLVQPTSGVGFGLVADCVSTSKCKLELLGYDATFKTLRFKVVPTAGHSLAPGEVWTVTFTAKTQAPSNRRNQPFRFQNKAYVNGLSGPLLTTPNILVLPVGAPSIEEIQ